MSSSNCCFLSCIQISQEAGKVVWYSHLKNFPQFVVIHVNVQAAANICPSSSRTWGPHIIQSLPLCPCESGSLPSSQDPGLLRFGITCPSESTLRFCSMSILPSKGWDHHLITRWLTFLYQVIMGYHKCSWKDSTMSSSLKQETRGLGVEVGVGALGCELS